MRKEYLFFYLLGIIGLFPIFGFVIGLCLVIYGIIKDKKSIVFIGIIDMSITIILVVVLLYFSKNTKSFQPVAIDSSINNLNSLVESIEFHNYAHGQYPDSLGEIKFLNPLYNDVDQIQVIVGNEERKYKYSKVDSGYYLFSLGVDGVEFTSDDVFPTNTNDIKTGYLVSPAHESLEEL